MECGTNYGTNYSHCGYVGTKPAQHADAQALTDNREQVKPIPNIVTF
jgi:hypothetical protein